MNQESADVTTLDEPQLRAWADQLRNAIGPVNVLPDYLRECLGNAADACDLAAAGKLDQSGVQSAVDALNVAFDRQTTETMNEFDEAAESDDPERWRDALMGLLAVLPDEQLAVVKDVFGIVLNVMIEDAAAALDHMDVAGSC